MVTMVSRLFFSFSCLIIFEKGTSHRARIPSPLNWEFKILKTSSLYTLNVSAGKIVFFCSK